MKLLQFCFALFFNCLSIRAAAEGNIVYADPDAVGVVGESIQAIDWKKVGKQDFDLISQFASRVLYEHLAGKCQPDHLPAARKLSSHDAVCEEDRDDHNKGDLHALAKELKEKMFFDQVAVIEAENSQCQMDYWSALSTQAPDESFIKSNKILVDEFASLKEKVSTSHVAESEVRKNAALEAQKLLLGQMVDIAVEQDTKQKKIDALIPLRKTEEIHELNDEIMIAGARLPLIDDDAGEKFYQKSVLDKVKWYRSTGTFDRESFIRQNLAEFEKKVVQKKMHALVEKQKDIANMHGQYFGQHGFKTGAFRDGIGDQLIYGLGSVGDKNQPFREMACELNAKYGIGAEMSADAVPLVEDAVVALFTGGASLFEALAVRGLINARAGRMLTQICAAKVGKVGIGEFVVSGLQGCFKDLETRREYTPCNLSKSVKEKGILSVLSEEDRGAECLKRWALGLVGTKVSSKIIKELPPVPAN